MSDTKDFQQETPALLSDKEKIDKDNKKKQQQSDPQITELKGFVDPNEELEPKLENDSDHK